MELLFNKGGAGTDEIKKLLPYVDADLDYDFLEPDIIRTTNDVVDIIGIEVYNAAEPIYQDDPEPNGIEGRFLRAIRYPIAINAYRLFAPTNDLTHTNNGRKMRSDDSEKTPFEWMIDRDNSAQEQRYYRALDDLISFLDKLKKHEDPQTAEETFETELAGLWSESESYKLTHNLFIRTVADFDKFFPIKSRLLLNNLSPGMADCELYEIIPRIKRSKYDELKEKLKSRTAFTDQKDIDLLKLIKQAMVGYAMAWAMPRFSVNLFPEGILQHYTSDQATTRGQKPALNIEPEAARMAFQSDCDRALIQIEDLLAPPAPPVDPACLTTIPDIIYGDKFLST
jgi:hypothetical protein